MIGWLKYQLAWWRWFRGYPGYRLGDPSLGEGQLRTQNRQMIKSRYLGREPRPEDFGLLTRKGKR